MSNYYINTNYIHTNIDISHMAQIGLRVMNDNALPYRCFLWELGKLDFHKLFFLYEI